MARGPRTPRHRFDDRPVHDGPVRAGPAAAAGRNRGRLTLLLSAAAGIALVQAGVGAANVLLRIPIELTALHSLLAAVLVLLTTLACDEAFSRQREGVATALSHRP